MPTPVFCSWCLAKAALWDLAQEKAQTSQASKSAAGGEARHVSQCFGW